MNNTPNRPVSIIHRTRLFWSLSTFLIGWTVLTTIVTYGLVVESYAIPEKQCQVSLNTPDKQETKADSQQSKLSEKIVEVYKVSVDKAEHLAKLATAHTQPNIFPSPELVVAIAYNESSFREHVTSSAGAKGLLQVMPGNSTGSDTFSNVYDAVNLLREYNKDLGSVYKTLQAYNAGITAFKTGKVHNQQYAEDVLRHFKRLKES